MDSGATQWSLVRVRVGVRVRVRVS